MHDFIAEEINIYHFSPDVKDSLVQIADWLIAHNEDDFMNVYESVCIF